VNAAATLAGEVESAGLDAALLRERLAEFGIGPAEAAALRALGRSVNADALERAVLAAMGPAHPDEPPMPDEPAHWRFCRAMARLAHWNLEPDLFNEIVHAWLECSAEGADAEYKSRVAKALLDCCADALVEDGERLSQPEFEILTALQRVALWVVSLLGDMDRAHESAVQPEGRTFDAAFDLRSGDRFATLLDEQFDAAGDVKVGLIIVRVDHDKAIMPILSAADRALAAELAERMRASLREQDTLYALGAFEWAIVLRDLQTPAQVALACSRVVETCLTPLRIGERRHLVIAHAGGTCYPDDATEAVALVRAARLALDAAQRHSTPYELFHSETGVIAQRESELEEELVEALTHNRLLLELQPQVDCATGRCNAAEALLRWQRRSGEWVAPPLVIATAERLGVLRMLSRWLVNQSARVLTELHRKDIDVRLSINLTASDLQDIELPDLLQQALSTWGAPPHRFGVELTESAVIADEARTYEVLSRLRDLGCSVAIDDFGTGYSSMIYLRRLPLHEMKLDRTFVRNIASAPQDRAIVGALVHLAHSLGMEAVAEGVEDDATLAIVRELGCERAQGYLFGKPMPVAEFTSWWQTRHRGLTPGGE
jgi:predicted signal transduction protein with EAL and GGDEF domain